MHGHMNVKFMKYLITGQIWNAVPSNVNSAPYTGNYVTMKMWEAAFVL
jgi:hypothetical protein